MNISWLATRLLAIPFAAMALTVGCGEGRILQSPTGPSGTIGSTTLSEDGSGVAATASITGDFDPLAKGGNGKKPDNPGNLDSPGGGPGRSHEERVVGIVTANNDDTIVVNGVTIAAGVDAVIRHGNRTLTMADIAVGDHVQARGALEETTLVAVEIKVQDLGNDNEEPDANAGEIKGPISGLSPLTGCPVVTFTIGTTQITSSAATTFDDVTCATLANGAIVEVEGTTAADGSIVATKIELEAGPDEVTGKVWELTGTASCGTATPALTFKVGPTAGLATTVNTTTLTAFSGVTCAALANGARVEVEGTEQADGSITAASVELH